MDEDYGFTSSKVQCGALLNTLINLQRGGIITCHPGTASGQRT
jgi:hypothetical protein